MSAAFVLEAQSPLLEQPHHTAGRGWHAKIYDDEIELIVSPEGDVLPKALHKLFTKPQLRFWTLVWDHEDEAGRDVYLLTRGRATVC